MEIEDLTPIQKRFALAQLSAIGISNGKKDFNFTLKEPIKVGSDIEITQVSLTKPLVVTRCFEAETNMQVFLLSDNVLSNICEEMENTVISILHPDYLKEYHWYV